MDKLTLLLKENWALLQELFELPSNINTNAYGDEFFKNGEYADSFEFHHQVTGKSGKTYTMVFRFFRRNLKTHADNTRAYTVPHKGGSKELQIAEKLIPVYEISFYPQEKEGSESRWELLNDIDPIKIITVNGYFAMFHASQLAKLAVPSPFVDYIFRPYKEKHEKTLDAANTKRGAFYQKAIPKVLESLSSKFKLKVLGVSQIDDFTMVKIKIA